MDVQRNSSSPDTPLTPVKVCACGGRRVGRGWPSLTHVQHMYCTCRRRGWEVLLVCAVRRTLPGPPGQIHFEIVVLSLR